MAVLNFFELIPFYINLFSLRTGLFLKCWLVHGTVFTIRMKQTFRPQCANLLKQNAKIYAFFESKMRNCVKRFFHFVLNPFHYSVYLENINVDDFNNIYNLTIWSLAHQAMNVITTWPFENKFFALFHTFCRGNQTPWIQSRVWENVFLFRRNRVSLQAGADIIRKGNPGIKINQALILRCDTVRRRKHDTEIWKQLLNLSYDSNSPN